MTPALFGYLDGPLKSMQKKSSRRFIRKSSFGIKIFPVFSQGDQDLTPCFLRRRIFSGNPAENQAIERGAAAQPDRTVHTSRDFTGCI